MDPKTLVKDDLRLTENYLRELHQVLPIKAAFWLKVWDESTPFLYIASDCVEDRGHLESYGEVARAAQTLHEPDFDIFRVKLIRSDSKLAKHAIELNTLYPPPVEAPTRGLRYPGTRFADLNVDDSYVYPPSVWQTEVAQVTT